jgi:hypothetical protein
MSHLFLLSGILNSCSMVVLSSLCESQRCKSEAQTNDRRRRRPHYRRWIVESGIVSNKQVKFTIDLVLVVI